MIWDGLVLSVYFYLFASKQTLGGAMGPFKGSESVVCILGPHYELVDVKVMFFFFIGSVYSARISQVRARTETAIHHVCYKYSAL